MSVVDEARAVRAAFVRLAQYAPDEAAVQNPTAYDTWRIGEEYAAAEKVRSAGRLYKCIQAHTSQEGWEPENAPSLWEAIDEVHAGTAGDPIPAVLHMRYELGKYYSEDGNVYLCTRDTEIPVAYLPSQLLGIYFEVAV